MPEVTYPSSDFPAPAPVSLTFGQAWEPMPLANALVAVGATTPAENGFRANVTVTSNRTTGMTLAEAAQATQDALVASPEWAETGREFRTGFGGLETFRIEGAFVHPQAGTLYQAAETAVISRGPFVDVVQAVGTCAASEALAILPEIRTIIDSARADQS